MDEKVRDQLTYQLESIDNKLEVLRKEVMTLAIKLAYGEGEFPEDADIMLSEMDNAVGDAYDFWNEIYPELKR